MPAQIIPTLDACKLLSIKAVRDEVEAIFKQHADGLRDVSARIIKR